MKYLSEKLIQDSFLRLRSQKGGGKKGVERTSALMYFLAFDALLKRTGINPPLDLNPESSSGKNNRDFLTREFARLVLIKTVGLHPCHVLDLGEIKIDGHAPEKRFSSNFLTVSVKKSTTSEKVYEYPSRPTNPLLVLGPKATGLTWGIDRHSDWKENLPVFLNGRQTKTPFHDLACFVLRQRGFDSAPDSLQDGLVDGLSEVFTEELCSFWKTQLSMEKVYAQKVDEPFQDSAPSPFADHSWASGTDSVDETAALNERIGYLEGVLKMHHIEFAE